MPRISQVNGLTEVLSPKLYVIGDSFSTIRRANSADSANGRYSSTGFNLWDVFRMSFHSPLTMDTTTNYAREGAMAVQDWRSTAGWSAINPIPSVGSQFTTLQADNPTNKITSNAVLGILIGTNDKASDSGSVNAADGSVKPTAQQVSDAIVAVINRAITHGFRNLIIMHPEGKWCSTVSPILFPAITSIVAANNWSVKIVQCYADTAMLEFSNPYLPDNLHPSPSAHRRLGEVLSDAWRNNTIVDFTKNFLVSTKGSNTGNFRELGFTNYNPNSDAVRLRLVDEFNCFQAQVNQQMILRGYNGITIRGAHETGSASSPVGAGKNDSCVTIAGNFWEHRSLLDLQAVAGVPAAQSPYITGRTGTTLRFQLRSAGGMRMKATEDFLSCYDDTGAADLTGNTGLKAQIWADGSFNSVSKYCVGGTQVVGARRTTWNAGESQSNFLGSAGTAASSSIGATAAPALPAMLGTVIMATTYNATTAAFLASVINAQNGRINQIILDLRAHGLINP